MKDMFYNYENNINKKEYPQPIFFLDNTKALENDPGTKIVYDVKGNEIGIQVPHNNEYTLYFSLCQKSCGFNLLDLIDNSTVVFRILSTQHEQLFSKEYKAVDIFNYRTKRLAIHISADESKEFDIDSYRIDLTLCWPGGSYELYPENAGLLLVR